MDTNTAIATMSALAQPTRLRVVMALADRFPDGVAVGELADLAETPPNTMSSHLAILARAGLVVASRVGRVVQYSVHEDALRNLAEFLTAIGPDKTGPTRQR